MFSKPLVPFQPYSAAMVFVYYTEFRATIIYRQLDKLCILYGERWRRILYGHGTNTVYYTAWEI